MKKQIVSVVLASAFVAVPAAHAELMGIYAGLSVGQASAKDFPSAAQFDAELASFGITTASSSVDDSDTAYKLFVGYRANKYFAVEASWADLGEATYSAQVTSPMSGNANASWEASAFALSALGILPLTNQFEVFGKLGYSLWDADLRVSASSGGVSLGEESADEDGSSVVYGLGASFSFTPNFAVRAEWERYDGIGDDDTGESDVDMWSVGLQYNF